MTKPLVGYQTGKEVVMGCYKKGCESVQIPIRLGEEAGVDPQMQTPKKKIFSIPFEDDVRCYNCGTIFGDVVVNSLGPGKKPLIHGYDPEPA